MKTQLNPISQKIHLISAKRGDFIMVRPISTPEFLTIRGSPEEHINEAFIVNFGVGVDIAIGLVLERFDSDIDSNPDPD
jgi:hypothetical protein